MPTSPALIDLSVLMQRVGGDPQKVKKYAQLFLDTVRNGMEEIAAALDDQNIAEVAKLGHRLRSPALTVGATAFSALCETLEQLREPENLVDARGVFEQMRACLDQIAVEIELALETTTEL